MTTTNNHCLYLEKIHVQNWATKHANKVVIFKCKKYKNCLTSSCPVNNFKHKLSDTCRKFHQCFTFVFFVQTSFWQLFLVTCLLKKLPKWHSYKKGAHVKRWWNWLQVINTLYYQMPSNMARLSTSFFLDSRYLFFIAVR
jgi:hypothetical protein